MSPRELYSRYGDAILAVLLATVYALEIAFESGFDGDRAISYPLALAFCGALRWRRRLPLPALVLGAVIIEASNLAAPQLAETGAFLFGFIITIYSAGRYSDGRLAIACAVLVLAAIPAAAIEPGIPVSFSDFAFFVMFFGGPFAGGRIVRRRVRREGELEVERDTHAHEAVTEERARIARELHDVVAHAISVMVLQARGGRRMLNEDPAETRSALDAIEHSGEQALTEMRRLLGMLRQDDDELALAPQPSLSRIDDLVSALSATGLPVEVTIEGDPFELPPGIDLSAYRIVQEALTNALKHAGPARAHVFLRYSADNLEIEIVDDGPGTENGGGTGHGLAGIGERVAVYGGELESGRRPEGGYALRARLPLTSSR